MRTTIEIPASLRQKGSTISNEDILIGATCIQLAMPLCAENRRYFKGIPGLWLYEAREE